MENPGDYFLAFPDKFSLLTLEMNELYRPLFLSYNVSHDKEDTIMATSTMIHIRIDERIKKEATETLGDMGLSVSDAVRVFLTRVVAEKQFPFALKVPNATTRRALEEADEIIHLKRARYQNGSELIGDLEKNSGQ